MSMSLNSETLKRFTYNKIYIETGTFTGGSLLLAIHAGFEVLHSIEIDPKYFRGVCDNFAGFPQAHLYLGNSLEILPKLLEDIDEPVTFFLDSHLNPDSTLSEIHVPLLMELDIIKGHSVKNHTILIDDRRIFGYNGDPRVDVSSQWLSITENKVIEKLLEINPRYGIYYLDSTNAENDIVVAEIAPE